MVQKHLCVRRAKAYLKWTVSKWKSVLWSDESKFYILVGCHGCRVLQSKEEGDLPACHQHSVQKPAFLMVWGCISAYGMGSLHVLEGIMNAERYKGFRATYAPLLTMCISAGQCKNCILKCPGDAAGRAAASFYTEMPSVCTEKFTHIHI